MSLNSVLKESGSECQYFSYPRACTWAIAPVIVLSLSYLS